VCLQKNTSTVFDNNSCKKRTLIKNKAKIEEIPHLMNTVILHFGHMVAEKIEFEVVRSYFRNVEK